MLRSRTIREGSVGLLALVGIALFGGIALWLRGISFREESYQVIGEFPNVNGIQVGDSVRYRGLKVGKITEIQPGTNGVDVIMEISSSKLLIPKNALIQASSSGLIGQTFIDIVPQEKLPNDTQAVSPLSANCDSTAFICNSDRLEGQPGITLDDLLPLMFRMTNLYSDPRFFENINAAVENTSTAATEVTSLSQQLSEVITDVQGQVNSFSNVTEAITNVANDASTQISSTADEYKRTATELRQLTENVNNLVAQNRGNLVTTLDNIKTTSDRLQNLSLQIEKTVNTADTEKLVQDLAILTANAAEASDNLKNISETFSSPTNLVTLQQTLDSARVTFANAQKITADLEQMTGDPAFRNNFKNLVNGLSNLISSTQQLEQQVYTNQILEPVQQRLTWQTSSFVNLESNPNSIDSNNKFSSFGNEIDKSSNTLAPKVPIPSLNKQPKP